jgi:hypothetical protein
MSTVCFLSLNLTEKTPLKTSLGSFPSRNNFTQLEHSQAQILITEVPHCLMLLGSFPERTYSGRRGKHFTLTYCRFITRRFDWRLHWLCVMLQSVPKVAVHCNIRQTRAPVRSSSRSIALQAAAAQCTSGAVKKRVQTCLQARGGHSQHLL